MGFNTTATTTTLTARLTPSGRKKLVSSDNTLITSFSLGDSDANYYTSALLATGQVPAAGGDIGGSTTASNSVCSNASLRSALILNSTGTTKKAVESQSSGVTSELQTVGQVVLSATQMTQSIVDRTDTTDGLVNLFYSFGLPLTEKQISGYTATTYANGGFADTALSGIASSKILVIGIPTASYGELIDGKAIKVSLTNTLDTYNIYSTFENKGQSNYVEDATYAETSVTTKGIGTNIAFLFSDEIMTPNGGVGALSWATGFATHKPFSVNGKQLYNMVTDTNVSESADTAVGIAFLDKGFIVLTHPDIVDNFFPISNSADTVVTINSVATAVSQNITCIANRGEFGNSTNPTFGQADTPRISEVALYDKTGDMIALAKTDKHIIKDVNQFVALSIKITL
jgi:hypothetical protein